MFRNKIKKIFFFLFGPSHCGLNYGPRVVNLSLIQTDPFLPSKKNHVHLSFFFLFWLFFRVLFLHPKLPKKKLLCLAHKITTRVIIQIWKNTFLPFGPIKSHHVIIENFGFSQKYRLETTKHF